MAQDKNELAIVGAHMFYIIYNTNLKICKTIYIYMNKKQLDAEWLEKFTQHCEENNLSAFEVNAKYKLTPLGEDEVSIDPIEIKDFASWRIHHFNSQAELNKFIAQHTEYEIQIIK